MTSASVTRRELNVALRTYAETTIDGVILPQGSNVSGLPIGNYAKYAHTFFTPDVIYEGDQTEDANNDTYEVLNVQPYWWLDKFSHYTCELLKTVDVTLKTLTLGVQDTVTGWYAKAYADTTITMNLAPKGQSMIQTALGYHSKYEMSGVTPALVYEGDLVEDAAGDTYEIKQVAYYPTKRSTAFSYAVCALTKQTFADRPATSGTWHLDSELLRTDPRYRHRSYLAYLTAVNLKEDDGATNATYITCFDGADYPISRVFLTKAVDLVFSVGKEQATAKTTYNHTIYAFEESMPITLYAVNKSGLTATNLIEQAEQEIRHIVTDYPLGSVRGISSVKHDPVDLGECTLYSTTVTIRYTRANDDYTPTAPTFAHGIAFTYEGDRVAGGVEGTWTLTQGGGSTCTQTVTSDNNLYLNQTVFGADSSTVNGTNLSLPTNTYTKLRWRYKTSGNATAKIILTFNDTTTQTILAESASSTFTVGSASITAAETLDHITLFCCDGVGTVTYDYVQVYAGTFVLPNCVQLDPPAKLKDVIIPIPGMSGDLSHALGSELLEVTMECDLDMEPWSGDVTDTKISWKRPQTTGTKTDANKTDVFYEQLHLSGINEAWTWLDIGAPTMQFKARLTEIHPSYSGEQGRVTLVWREYRHGSANSESTSERFGLGL